MRVFVSGTQPWLRRWISWGGALLLAGAAPSASALELTALAGSSLHKPTLNPDPPVGTTVAARSAFSFGALASTSIGENYRFETGLIRHGRKTERNDGIARVEARYRGWLIPFSLQFMRADFLGFGFGPYVAFLSSATDARTTTVAGGAVTEAKVDDPNRKGVDIGLRANLRIAVPVWGAVRAVGDFAFHVGFSDLNKSGTADDKNKEFLLLAGIQMPIGSGDPGPATTTATGERP